METIKCFKCSSVDKFYTELKANNNVARCSICDTFIKNIPYKIDHVFYFGRYKNLKDIDDINYLEWMVSEKGTKPTPSLRSAIVKHIENLKFLAK